MSFATAFRKAMEDARFRMAKPSLTKSKSRILLNQRSIALNELFYSEVSPCAASLNQKQYKISIKI